ncbi:MAG TPA: histidine phosphatase family protein [Kofleriaceae bacterium]|nr:histidine phosphatase family protein [Kofleriaceae bacterium]
MQLFVIRHATAEDATAGEPDSERELTRDGERKLRRAIRGMRALGWQFDRVLTSPWHRAARTAHLLAPLRDAEPIATELLCQSPRLELLSLIGEDGASSVAVVGHEPWLGELIAWLAFGDRAPGEQIQLRKSGAVWLDGSPSPGAMKLRALLTPRVLRRLG